MVAAPLHVRGSSPINDRYSVSSQSLNQPPWAVQLGIPLVKLAGHLFSRSVRLMLPRELAHPVKELTKSADKDARTVRSAASGAASKGHKFGKAASDTVSSAAQKGRKAARKQVKNLV